MMFKKLSVVMWLVAMVAAPYVQAQYATHTPQTFFNDSTKKQTKAPLNWYNLDLEKDNVRGVSTEKAYEEFLQNKPSNTVVVAVIDSGIDIEHEDLEGKVWVNADEIAGNGIDDDKNGYVDDTHGWNFIGGKNGKQVHQDTYELTREYKRLNAQFKDVSKDDLSRKQKKEYEYYQSLKKDYEEKVAENQQYLNNYKAFKDTYEKASKLLKVYLEVDELQLEDVQGISSEDQKIQAAVQMMSYALANNITLADIEEGIEYFENGLEYGYNLEFDPRSIVGDNYNDGKEQGYGNGLVEGPDASHGTHVAGIIGANRGNTLGIQGIADNVQIMAIRAVPDGDERDKDIANAIYYAVDNGAQIINMSFGKGYSPDKELVDKAVKYAEKKGVLLIHAAGNDGANIDETENFPTPQFENKRKSAKNWLEVGASSWTTENNFVANFSNYGKSSVDIFAPGVDIYSSVPDSKYQENSGTSMAAPVVSGVAALLMSYYPELSAADVKEILVESAIRYEEEVNLPGSQDETISFQKLSKTGGIVNAYEAVKMAEKKTLSIRKK